MVGKSARPKRKLGANRMNPMAQPQSNQAALTSAEHQEAEAKAEQQTGRIMSEMGHLSPDVRARFPPRPPLLVQKWHFCALHL